MARPRRKKRPLVVTDTGRKNDAFWMAFTDVAREYEWRLLDLNMIKKRLPAEMKPAGSISREFADSPLIRELKSRGCHCIRYGNYTHPMDEELPAILPGREAAGRMAAEHFAARGYKHVGQVVSEPRANPDRMPDAFLETASELGMEMHLLKTNRTGPKTIDEVLTEWLRQVSKPIGILAYHDYLATRICLIAEQEGLLVPQEVAVLAMGNSFHCEMAPVPLSAIEADLPTQGREAAHLLKRVMDGETVPPATWIPPRGIVLRQSTDVLAVPDVIVANALTYIWEHFDWPLTVDDIAFEVGVSRSNLKRRFRLHLGRGINAELRRKRLERCRELLTSTTMSVAEVMKACGFLNRGYLHRSFLKEFGMTPGQYRKRHSGPEQSGA